MIKKNLLEAYIKSIIKEGFSLNKYPDLVNKINSKFEAETKGLDREKIQNWSRYYMSDLVINLLIREKLVELGSGESREGWCFNDQDWIIKVAKNKFGASIIKQEIEVYNKKHGPGASDLFVKVYDWDKKNEVISGLPYWMICQKVVILKNFNDLEALKQIFPTFWNAIKEEDTRKNYANTFRSFVSDTLFSMVNSGRSNISLKAKKRKFEEIQSLEAQIANLHREMIRFSNVTGKESDSKKYKNLIEVLRKKIEDLTRPTASKNDFYNAMISEWPNESSIKPFEDIVFEKDFERIAAGFGYIKTDDLHDENIGIIPSSFPSPEDFVIIDFMI